MGAVYLAIRDDQAFEKRVAVKVVKRGMDSDAVLDRFDHERRILANLDHPYISRLLDAGTAPDGRPYFVMEFVEGQPIVEYCAKQQLDLNAALELFRKVCDAVAFAHRKLIVHRDLKAGNILVTADGSPKLLDFGIAKLLDPERRGEETAPSGRILTLECASPEQIRGEQVTTSTDVYSLGLLLYELLAGRPPWNLRGVSRAEAEQIICSTQAPRPSSFRPHIPADLDNIVLMALRKDPARRYRSVDEFSEDIRRCQTGHPVIAREDSFSYRSMKFLGRNWGALTLSAGAVLGLIGGLVYANIERNRAEERLTEMLGMANQTLLDLHAQIERQPGSTQTRLQITKSTLEYLAGAAREAGKNQEVRSTLAKAYLATGDIQGYPDDPNLGDSSGALSSYREAEKLFGPRDRIPLARTYWHRGVVLVRLSRLPEGLASLRKAVETVRQMDSHDALMLQAGAYHSIAYAITPSDPEEGLANSRIEMSIFTKLAEREPDNLEVLNGKADSYLSTGGALVRRNRMEEALSLFRKSASILERLRDKEPNDFMVTRDLMTTYLRIGDTLGNPARRNLGDRRGALPYYAKAQALAEEHAAADPNNNLARLDLMEVRWRVGVVMDTPEDARASLAILDEARAIASAVPHGEEMTTNQTRAVATIDEYRGSRLASLGDLNGSVAAFEQAMQEARSIAAKDATDSSAWTLLLRDYGGLTESLALLGRRDEAVRSAKEAEELADRLAVSGPDRISMAVYVPRTRMWAGFVYQTLARKNGPSGQSRADWLAASESYSKANEAWQKLRQRNDFSFYKAEISECLNKLTECNRRSS
jgi:tetratricopeptide (TPR) repeat protein